MRYRDYIQKSDWWQKRRKDYLNSLPRKCCYICGVEKESGLHIHHRSYNRFYGELDSDLVALCMACRVEVHRRCKELGYSLANAHERIRAEKAGEPMRQLPPIPPKVKKHARH